MTAIAALIDKNGDIWVGGDSAGVAGQYLELRKDPKVFINKDFIIGYTSSFRMGQILQYKFDPPKHRTRLSVNAYMNTDFIDNVMSCLNENGFGNGRDKGGTFIVGYKKRLFIIDNDFQVAMPYQKYAAVGCGNHLCQGSLYTTEESRLKELIAPKERITMALKSAETFSSGVRGPFVIKQLKAVK